MDIITVSAFIIWFGVHIQPFFYLNNLLQRVDWTFKSTKKLDLDVSGSLNQSKTTGHCGFPMTNLQSVSIVDYLHRMF